MHDSRDVRDFPLRRLADYGAAVVFGFGAGGGGAALPGGGPGGGAVVALVARLAPSGRAGPSAASPPLDVLLFAAACAASGATTRISSLLPLAPVPGAFNTLARAREAARLAARAGLARPPRSAAVAVHSNAPALVGDGVAASLPALIHPRGPSAVVGWERMPLRPRPTAGGGSGGGRAA